jgi:flagellar biosynthesis/type III secretory pathway protein FliH
MEDYINHWGLAMEYAESKVKLEMGVNTTAEYDHQIAIKEGYEAGFLKAVELFKTNKELMIETFKIED